MAQPYEEPCSEGLIDAEPPQDACAALSRGKRALVLTACVLASAMAFIDGSALTVALPALRADFGADLSSVQWVINGYVLALASLTLIGGALADVHGRVRMLTIGCLAFGAASAACALAPSPGWLIGFRFLQGVAAAIVAPSSLALIGAIYPRAERNAAVGVWAAASALTTAGGPVLGGWLTDRFGWEAVFWINPPIAVAAVALLILLAPPDRRQKRGFDLAGAAILAASLGALAYGLSQIGSSETGHTVAAAQASEFFRTTITVPVVAGIAGIAAYAWWETRAGEPMTPPRLAGNRPFVGLNLATLLIYSGLAIMFFLMPFELIDRRGLDASQSGFVFLPFTLGVGLLSRLFGGIADRIGARSMLVAGPIGAAIAYCWMAAGQGWQLSTGILAPMSLLGFSFAVLVTPLTATVLSSVDDNDEGLASGINNAASRIAQLAGVALASGLASLLSGYMVGLGVAAAATVAGALVMALTVEPLPKEED
jgi:EmrB/QacA subfamily drug resistance transporter